MGKLTLGDRVFEYHWASDVTFDGIRLEVLADSGAMLFDVSLSEEGPIAINTFGNEVAADLLLAALEVAQRRK